MFLSFHSFYLFRVTILRTWLHTMSTQFILMMAMHCQWVFQSLVDHFLVSETPRKEQIQTWVWNLHRDYPKLDCFIAIVMDIRLGLHNDLLQWVEHTVSAGAAESSLTSWLPDFQGWTRPTFPISCNRQQGHLNPFVSANRAKKCYGHVFWLPRWVYTLTGSDKPSSFKQVAWTGHAVIQLIDRELGYILRVSITGGQPSTCNQLKYTKVYNPKSKSI